MTAAHDASAPAPERPLTRRAFLRASAGAGAPLLLAACGTTTELHVDRVSYAIDANGTSPPVGDLARLMTARAKAVGAAPVLTLAPALTLSETLRLQTRRGAFDPRTNTTPPVNGVVVVGAIQRGTLEPLAAAAIAHGVKLVSYPIALRRRTAAVVADQVAAAAVLARHAAAWGVARGDGGSAILLVLAPADQLAVNPYVPDGPAVTRALRDVLADRSPGRPVLVTQAADAAGGAAAVRTAVSAHPGIRAVLVWDDATALGAAQALAAAHPGAARADLYVGALGAPALTSRATVAALEGDGVLRAVVATRPRDLADALVDLPLALLRGRPARDVRLPAALLTPGSDALARHARDYARRPDDRTFAATALNPTAAGSAR